MLFVVGDYGAVGALCRGIEGAYAKDYYMYGFSVSAHMNEGVSEDMGYTADYTVVELSDTDMTVGSWYTEGWF
jgi:hypothetical protein